MLGVLALLVSRDSSDGADESGAGDAATAGASVAASLGDVLPLVAGKSEPVSRDSMDGVGVAGSILGSSGFPAGSGGVSSSGSTGGGLGNSTSEPKMLPTIACMVFSASRFFSGNHARRKKANIPWVWEEVSYPRTC